MHAGPDIFGLQLDDAYFMQGISQIQFLLGHLNMGDRTATLIRIAHDDLELIHGQGLSPLQNPDSMQESYLPDVWLTSICLFLTHLKARIELRWPNVLKPQR